MKTTGPILITALLLLACGPGEQAQPVLERELLDTDRAFARATVRRGAEGWASFFLEDGEMMTPGSRVVGRDAVRRAMRSAFEASDFGIEWEPEEARPDPSGDSGFTIGTYRTWGAGPEGPVVRDSGRYVTLWRRGPEGRWRVRLDVGLPSPAGR